MAPHITYPERYVASVAYLGVAARCTLTCGHVILLTCPAYPGLDVACIYCPPIAE